MRCSGILSIEGLDTPKKSYKDYKITGTARLQGLQGITKDYEELCKDYKGLRGIM